MHSCSSCAILFFVVLDDVLHGTSPGAPHACIVCEKPAPHEPVDGAMPAPWIYLANAKPLGALACSESCLGTALKRHRETGRVDNLQKERE
jgi:hypothetical protein